MRQAPVRRPGVGWLVWAAALLTASLSANPDSGAEAAAVDTVATLGASRRADLEYLAARIRAIHPNPFLHNSEAEWERRTAQLGEGVELLDSSGFFFRLEELASLADDLHTSVFPLADQGLLTRTYPLRLRWLEDGVVVRAAPPSLSHLVGARLETAAGRPVDEWLERLLAIVPGNRRLPRSNVTLAYLLCPDTFRYLGARTGVEPLALTLVDRHGQRRDVEVASEPLSLMEAYEAGNVVGWSTPPGWVSLWAAHSRAAHGVEAPLLLRRRDEPWWSAPSEDGKSLLVQINQPRPDAENRLLRFIAGLYDQLVSSSYERLVIDLRGNEGGWFVLTNALAGMIASLEKLNEPGRVFVLVGPDTVSAGVALAVQLERETAAMFVGEPTGSSPNSFGTYKPEPLPGSGYYFRVSTAKLELSVPEDDRPFLSPDLRAPERLADLLAGRDAVLDAALAFRANEAAAPLPWHQRWRRLTQRVGASGATTSGATTLDVVVENATAGVKLGCTLSLPAGAGPHPAAVLLSVALPNDRDLSLGRLKFFGTLADDLARQGVASLRCDDRGVGASGGDYYASTYAGLTDDALAVWAALRERPEVDPERVGFIGMSEGTAISALAAVREPRAAFVVLLSGLGLPARQALLGQLEATARAQGVPAERIAQWKGWAEETFSFVAAEADPERRYLQLLGWAREGRLGLGSGSALGPPNPEGLAKVFASPWYRSQFTYEPASTLAALGCPVLAVGGSLDLYLPSTENLRGIHEALAAGGNPDFAIVRLPGLNHLLQAAKTGLMVEHPFLPDAISPRALEVVGHWLAARFVSRPLAAR